MATIPTSNRQRIDINNPIITRIQVEGNDTVSFLNGTVAPYQYVRGMSQIMPQTPTYISYRYDSITISQVSGDSFTFTIYAVTDVGGNTFTPLTFQDPADVVQAKTIEIYRLLVTAVFKGCCECGNTEPECSIQYTYVQDNLGTLNGEFDMITSPNRIYFNYVTGNNQNFTNFFPIIQDGSWVFIFSKTDPTVYAVLQLSSFSDGGTTARFDYILLDGNGLPFVTGTQFCIDFTSVGGSLVQGWQDTLDINSILDKDNTVDGAGFDFVFDNNSSFTINSVGGSIQTSVSGASLISGALSIDVAPGYIDIITPGYGAATTGMVLALDSFGHVEYTLAGTGTISSIGLFMPSAFTVSTPNPLTSNGDFTVTGAGTDLEYINGLGELATLPVYTVENGLHTKESPADPLVFHLGGQLIEDTLIETTEVVSPGVVNEWQLSVRGAGGTDGQNTQFPFGVANLGDGGVATFQDYGSGDRPNPSVEIVGDVDLAQPLLELNMAGSLPTADDTLLRLRYTGDPSLAMMTMDYQFRNNNAVVANSNFVGSRLSTEVVSFVDGDEQTRFEVQLVDNGTLSNKLELQGFGQLVLNEYATSAFSNTTSNINNDLEYVLAVDTSGNVFKKLSEGGGTVTEVDATGLLTTSPDPITTTGTVTSEMNSGFLVGRYDAGVGVFQEITVGTGLTLSAGGELSADAGGGTVTEVNATGLLTTSPDPITTTGTVTSEMNSGFLVGRYDAGVGVFQEITIGSGLTLTGDTLSADGGGGTYTVDNGLSPDPLNANNFQLGGTLLKDTSIDTQQFGLAVYRTNAITTAFAPVFGVVNGDGFNAAMSVINSPSVGNAPVAIFLDSEVGSGNIFPSEIITLNKSSILNINQTGIRMVKTPNGLGSSLSIDYDFSRNVNPSSGVSGVAVRHNAIVTDATQATFSTSFEVHTSFGSVEVIPGSGLYIPTMLRKMQVTGPGQMILDNYTTSTSFASSSGTSVGVLNVDSTGKVFVGTGGGGGGTYASAQGIWTEPGSPETFMLGAPSAAEAVSDIPFSGVDRYIYTADRFLKINGANEFGKIFQVENTGYSAASFKSKNYVADFISTEPTATECYAIYSETIGPSASPIVTSNNYVTAVNTIETGITVKRYFNDGGSSDGVGSRIYFQVPNADGGGGALGSLEFWAPDASSLNFTSNFDVYTQGAGGGLSKNLTVKGSGQLNLDKYGQTPANFPATPVWALGVDATGNVVEFTPGGGGGLKSGNAIQGPPGEYTATISGVTAYTAGEAFMIKFDSTNEGASTLDINSLGPIDIFKNTNVKISSGDIKTDQEIMVVYDGTNFQAIGLVTNQLLAYVHNSEAAPITRGQVVYAFGASGDRMSVKLALANADATSAKTIGMVYDSSIAAGGEGYIIIQGVIEGINTSAFAAGATLYLSGTTPGGYVSTPTYAPTHRVYVGIVEKSNAGNGQIYVRCQNGYELDELHDVQAQSPNDNDTLYFDSTDSQWKTASIPTILGYTPAQRDTFTIRMGVGPVAPADNTTYYLGEGTLTLSTVATLWDNKMAYACKLVGAQIMANNTTATATAEASTISVRINNTTDVLLLNTVVFTGAPPTSTSYTVTGLSQSIAANDEITIKWQTPTWATNPTNAQLVITLFFERT